MGIKYQSKSLARCLACNEQCQMGYEKGEDGEKIETKRGAVKCRKVQL